MKHRSAHFVAWLLCCAIAAAAQSTPANISDQPFIPAGSKIPLALKLAISTKNAKAGDPVYAETVLPVIAENRMVIPAGTTVLGVVTRVKRGGRTHGRAQIQLSFTSLIFADGRAVPLSGSVDNTPGADNLSVPSAEGTIERDSDAPRKFADGAHNASHGMMSGTVGGLLLTKSFVGMQAGAGVGIAVGLGWALFRRGGDLKLEPGAHIEMVITHPVAMESGNLPGPQASEAQ